MLIAPELYEKSYRHISKLPSRRVHWTFRLHYAMIWEKRKEGLRKMCDLTIREAQPQDAPFLLEYLKQVGGESDNLLFGAEGLPAQEDDECAFLERLLHARKSVYLLALRGEAIVGQCSLICQEDRPRIAHWGSLGVTVRKPYWHQGIGAQLLARVIDFARNTAQLELIELEVRSDNAPAIALYRKFGFEKVGAFPQMIKLPSGYAGCDRMVLRLTCGA